MSYFLFTMVSASPHFWLPDTVNLLRLILHTVNVKKQTNHSVIQAMIYVASHQAIFVSEGLYTEAPQIQGDFGLLILHTSRSYIDAVSASWNVHMQENPLQYACMPYKLGGYVCK